MKKTNNCVFEIIALLLVLGLSNSCSKHSGDVVPTFVPSQINWTQTKGPFGGTVNSLTQIGNTLLAGTGNGVYISTDNGSNWKQSSLTSNVYCLGVNGNTIFAGTVDKSGIFMSTDNGSTWTQPSTALNNEYILDIKVSGNTIFAAASQVYVSIDNGSHWALSNNGIPPASIVERFTIVGTSIFGAGEGGVYKSGDDGVSWVAVNTGLEGRYVYSITSSNGSLFAGTDQGLFISGNNGDTWAASTTINYTNYIPCIVASGAKIYASTTANAVLYSPDFGASWSIVNPGILDDYVSSILINGNDVFLASSNYGIFLSSSGGPFALADNGINDEDVTSFATLGNTVLAGTYGGVFKSTDNGSSWTELGTANFGASAMAVVGNTVIVGSTNGGVFQSADNGSTWTQTGNGPIDVSSFLVMGKNIFASSIAGVFISSDNGNTWTAASTGLPGAIYNSVISLGAVGNTIFAGINQGGIFKSSDNGSSWEPVTTNSSIAKASVYGFAVLGGNIFAATNNGVYSSTDNGTSWTSVNTGISSFYTNSITVDGNNILVGTGDSGVFLSTNNGASWTAVNTGLSSKQIVRIKVIGNKIIAGTTNGIFTSPI